MIKFKRLGIVMGPSEVEGQFGSFARFNPGILLNKGFIHMLYRSTNNSINDIHNYISSIGYALFDINLNILYDSNNRVIYPSLPEEIKGCEDPRIVEFEDNFYIFYTAYNGKETRVAIAETNDFKKYKKLGIINNIYSEKDSVIFPERINKKIAYIHRIGSSIQLDYFENFDQLISINSWKNYKNRIETSTIMKSEYSWESQKIGNGVPPIKTKKGWLLLYHGVDEHLVYRMGAALLDLENPSKVIARVPYPLLEPEEKYELYGEVNNVIFPEGGYIYKDELYIYYGAADKYIALAKIEVDVLLNELTKYPMKNSIEVEKNSPMKVNV